MDRIEFKEKMERDGFTVSEKSMAAGTVNRDHTHPNGLAALKKIQDLPI